MKIRTKFLAAVLATATAFSCALTASALDPTPKITLDNTTMPAIVKDGKATATLTLKSSDFTDVTGAKITITLPETVNLESAKITDGNWTVDQDYKVDKDNRTVTLVDVFNIGDDTAKNLSLNLEVTVSNVAIGSYPITVSGQFADTVVDQVHAVDFTTGNTLVISREEKAYTTASAANDAIAAVTPETGYFVPAGGVYTDSGDGTYTYYDKISDGTFTDLPENGNIEIQKCPLPTGGKKLTTFGNSKQKKIEKGTYKDEDYAKIPAYKKDNGIQFGTYVTEGYVAGKYGTLVIMGDYNAFRNYYSLKGKTETELLDLIIKRYDTYIDKEIDGEVFAAGDPLTLKGGTNYITVKKVAQTKLMWEGNSAFQYAVRLYDLVDDKSYTAVAYSVVDGVFTFSSEIQTKVNPFKKAEVQ